MPSTKIQKDILKKEYFVEIKKILKKLNELKPNQLVASNGKISAKKKD